MMQFSLPTPIVFVEVATTIFQPKLKEEKYIGGLLYSPISKHEVLLLENPRENT